MSRVIGDLRFKNNDKLSPEEQKMTCAPDITSIDLKGVDFIIVACDGIWDVLSNQQVVDFIENNLKEQPDVKLSVILKRMFERIISKEGIGVGSDNMSAIIIDLRV
jgi:protein phosphatase PTC2/3